jgi:hypothetical protein
LKTGKFSRQGKQVDCGWVSPTLSAPFLLERMVACYTFITDNATLFPSVNSGRETVGFRFGKRGFFLLARKLRGCAEVHTGTPHKQSRRLTPRGGKSTLSGRKLPWNYVAGPRFTAINSGNAALSIDILVCHLLPGIGAKQ